MRNPLVREASYVLNAYEAIRRKLGRHEIEPTADGDLEIHQPGKPTLTITRENARRWAQEVEEAQADV